MEKYIINPITGDKILSTEFIVNDYFKIKEENEQLKKEIKEYQEELSKADSITQSCIFDGAKESAISYRECLNELDKYKSLYENEKDHTDTLKRIIKGVKEELEKHLNARSYGNHKYELFDRKYLEDLLDLLKEIK